MPAKSVACAADVAATPGTVPLPGSTGTWTAGPLTLTPYANLTVGGSAVMAQAACTFSFSGTVTASGNPTTGSAMVTLSPETTVLQCGGGNILRDGDSAKDSTGFGNTISVTSSRILASG